MKTRNLKYLKTTFILLVFIFCTSLMIDFSMAASCCGGGGGGVSLITGDFRSQMSITAGYSSVIGDVTDQGDAVFRHPKNQEYSQDLKLDYSYLISPFVQAGASIPFTKRTRKIGEQSEDSFGLGDVSAQIGYEYLPELTYSEWKPRGIGYFKVTLPTSPSIYNFDNKLATDARGRGFYTFGIGSLFLKQKGRFDFSLNTEVHQGLTRTFNNYGQSTKITPSLGGSALVGFGFSPKTSSPWRLGFQLGPIYEGQKEMKTKVSSASTPYQLVWDSSVSLSYLVETALSLNLTYSDQTLFGPAHNTTLSRSVNASFQKRWSL